MNQIDLNELERQIFRSTFDDGLIDIFIGVILSQFAITPLLTDLGWGDFWSSAVFAPVFVIILGGILLLKKYLIIPRLGAVKLAPKRKSRLKLLLLSVNILLIIGIIAGIFFFKFSSKLHIWMAPAFFCLMLLCGFSVAAYLLNLTRFYIYGVLNGAAVIAGELLFRYAGVFHHGFPKVFGVTSSIMIIIGIVLFARFLQRYPKSNPDLTNQGDVYAS